MQLEENEVHIWSANLMTTAEEEAQQGLLLTPDERERSECFHFPIHKKRFTAARATLRQILSVYLSLPASDIRFAYTEHEKPHLGMTDSNSLEFNLSHSGDLAIYAFTLNHAVGIDIEKMKDTYQQTVAERYFSARENADLLSLPLEERVLGFYRVWSRKEAMIKAVGKGLHLPLASFSVSVHGHQEVIKLENEAWTLLSLPLHPSYASALACSQTIKKISYWRFFNQSPKLDKVSLL